MDVVRPARARHRLHRSPPSATRADGRSVERTRSFHTVDLTLDEQTYAAVAPLDGETVGVGMPVVVTFDLPVTDRAALREAHARHQHPCPARAPGTG